MGGGHYYAETRTRSSGVWVVEDDASVSSVSADAVVSPDAYILFHAKTTIDSFFRQTLSEPWLWPHIVKIPEAQFSSTISEK